MVTTSTTDYCEFPSSNIPLTLFHEDSSQSSFHNYSKETKELLWYKFMYDVLLHIPRTSKDMENMIKACHEVNEYDIEDQIDLNKSDVEEFQTKYSHQEAINYITRDSFLYRAFNKAFRMLNTDMVISFHPFIKDLDAQLKQHHMEQMKNGTLKLPLTLYRGQAKISTIELERIRQNVGGLISIHTFLSTTLNYTVAYGFVENCDPDTSVLFEISVNDTELCDYKGIFVDINAMGKMNDEREIIFSVSSIFEIISAEKEDCCFWYIKLKLATCKEDEFFQRFRNEIYNYLSQNSGKQIPWFVFKQLLAVDSISYARPFIELIQFFLPQTIQLFLHQTYEENGDWKKSIEKVPELLKLLQSTTADITHPNRKIINFFFDVLHHFHCFKNNQDQEEIIFGDNDDTSLLCLGGFLFYTGDLYKGVKYFQLLLENESINDKMKLFINGYLATIYPTFQEKESISKSCQDAIEIVEHSMEGLMPASLTSVINSAHIEINHLNQQTDGTMNILESWLQQEQSSNTFDEKLRLIHLGHACYHCKNFVEAVNYWEEAVEIESYMTFSAQDILNAATYIQLAVGYFSLNNKIKALDTFVKGIERLKCYYPATHRMFGTLDFLHGFYLMQNKRSDDAINCFKQSLENSNFSTDNEFCLVIKTLLASAYIQSGDLDSAEQTCHEALSYTSANNEAQIIYLRNSIADLRIYEKYNGRDSLRQQVETGIEIGHLCALLAMSRSNNTSQKREEETWTLEKLISVADDYRHRENIERSEFYYSKAIEKLTETDSKPMWNIYRKIVRLGNNDDQYWDYFIQQYSKYDDNNPNHLSMIATLQTILYRISLSRNEYKDAFDFLINSVLIEIKSLFHQTKTNSQFMSELLDCFFHYEPLAKVTDILTKLMEDYSNIWTARLQKFLSKYITLEQLAPIIYHETIDYFFEQIKSKYDTNESAKRIVRFLDMLLQFLRQIITPMEKSTTSFGEQLLQILKNYNDENSLWLHFIKALESICVNDSDNFFNNIDQFRLQTLTFERYKQLHEKLAVIFAKFMTYKE